MKKKFAPQSAAVRPAAHECFRSSVDEGGFFNLRASIGLFVFLAGLFLALFATANSLQLAFDTSASQPTEAKASVLLGGSIGIPFSETWTFTGNLNTARDAHTATLLANGMVLVVGGVDIGSVSSPSAEVYDPASGTWAVTGSLNHERFYHTATLLPDGKVLVAGGYNRINKIIESVELYDPATGSWTLVNELNTARFTHTATLLPDGMVLVAGGFGGSGT